MPPFRSKQRNCPNRYGRVCLPDCISALSISMHSCWGGIRKWPHRNLRDAQDARREIAREDACGAWSTFVRYCPCHSELRHSVIGKLCYQLQFPVDVALHVLARVVGAFIGAFVGIDRLGGKVAFRF